MCNAGAGLHKSTDCCEMFLPLRHNLKFWKIDFLQPFLMESTSAHIPNQANIIFLRTVTRGADMRSMHMPSLMVQALIVQIDSIIS